MKSQGRIVNISSISGILTSGYLGLYSMSKHALEAYYDALIQAVESFGMYVSLIEPGNFRSNIGKNTIERMRKEEGYRVNMTATQRKQLFKEVEVGFSAYNEYPDPFKVTEAIFDALYSENPKPRYLVGGNKNEVKRVIKRMFVELLQLNQNHEYSFKRDILIDMMDESISEI